MKNKFKGLLFSILLATSLFAQRNLTLRDLKTPYTYRVNPAVSPEIKMFIGLPMLGQQNVQITNRISSVNNLFVKNAQDSLVLNTTESFYNGMGKRTYIGVDVTNQILAFGFKVKNSYFNFDISNRLVSEVGFGSDLFKFVSQGNGGSLLGQRAGFDGLGASLMSYIEYGLGYSREINPNVSIGGRFKLLSGLANLSGTNTSFGITTDSVNYNLTFDGQADIKSANTLIFTDSAYMNNLDYMRLAKMAYNFSNFGMSFDLGATVKLSEKITANVSVIDLGFINWKTGVSNYSVDKFTYSFKGIDLNSLLSDSSDVAKEIVDSLTSIFNVGNSTKSYSTGLPTKIYLGGSYQWNNYISSGITFYNEFYNSSYRPGLVLSSTFSLRHWLGATLNYGIYSRSSANVGFGLRIRGFYVLTDNLVALLNYQAVKAASVCFGFNFVIGKPKSEAAAQ
jgi:hypothetical protein